MVKCKFPREGVGVTPEEETSGEPTKPQSPSLRLVPNVFNFIHIFLFSLPAKLGRVTQPGKSFSSGKANPQILEREERGILC